ncbi:MAG: class I SAM-dependent methyltransferase [Pseudomonadota bacterium]
MNTRLYNDLHKEGIYQYGSDELKNFEKQLTKYFSREYNRYKDNDNQSATINQGPLALAPEDLADNHYDEGLSFFQNFLDEKTMSYTMAYFDEIPDKALASNKSLEQAQIDKFALIAQRMRLKGDEKLLNFGCGFGYFESYLLNTYPDLQISSLTHSKDQYDFIIKRTKDSTDALSSERFHIFFGEIDNNSITLLGRDKYDVVSSVGFIEHINNIEWLFEIISELLVEKGRMFHHLIVSRDLIPQLLDPNQTLIGEYFPGGKVLPFTTLKNNFNNFTIDEAWFINGINYWKTLEKWHANFWRNMARLYPEEMDSERVRYWNNYFVLCKAMFLPENGLAYGNGQYLFYKKA